MEEENKQEVEKKDVQEEQKKDSSLDDLKQEEYISIIKSLRSEAASNRIKAKELETKLDGIKALEDKAKEEDMKKRGEYDKIIAEKDKEIESLKKDAEEGRNYRKSEVENIKKSLGEDWLDEYENLSLSALKKMGERLTKSTTIKIDVDDPKKGAKKTTLVELNDEDKKEALFMFPNLTENEAYDFYKDIKLKKLEVKKKKET